MPTTLEAAVRAALAPVEEPELRRGLGELGLVRGVAIDGATVAIAIADPLPDWGHWAELAERVRHAAGAVDGVEQVAVDVQEMDEGDKVRVGRILKGEPAPNPLAVVDAGAPAPATRARVNPFTDARTRVIAIASGKGGVGKSSVTTNLSVALAQRGRRVAVIDADVWGFSLPRMLGVDHPPGLIDDVLVPPESYGVRLISMGFFAGEDQAVIWRGPMLHKALEQFLTDVFWADPEYLVVDMPPGTGDISLSIAEFLPRAEVIIVTTPQPAAQKVAQRAAALADQLGVPLLGKIPLVSALREGGDDGRPIVVAHPDDEASRVLLDIAEQVDASIRPKRVRHPELKIG